MSLIKNFQIYGDSLTELETECFNKLLGFNDLAPSLTISSLAQALNVSTTTVFRMVKKLNYKTFMAFRDDLLYHRHDEYSVDEKKVGTLNLMEREIQDTLDMLHNVDISKAIKQIRGARSVMICSSGMNKYVAKILAVKLSLYRIRTIYPDDQW
ncbi:MAG: HTH domain-containing protein, partial [Sporolactobacillus sp.]|nr:HTH domain-containing protein [Sporolactobacillus sp.]